MRNTKIEWATDTINPIRARNRETGKVGWYCEHATPGCENCYAEAMNRRLGTGIDFKRQNRDLVELFLDDNLLMQPLRWRKPRRIFWNSMTDTFGDFMPDEFIDRQFAVMSLTPQHTHLVLTKRAKRMREYMFARPQAIWDRQALAINPSALDQLKALGWPLLNVHLGVSVEDQTRADERIPYLMNTPAAKRFISAEPLLGPINLRGNIDHSIYPHAISWVIAGGESGPGARSMHPDWARSLRDQCAAGAAFFFKQWGEYGVIGSRVGKSRAGRMLDGCEHSEFPA